MRIREAVDNLRFLVDLEADLRTTRTVSAATVISLAYKTELSRLISPQFVSSVLLPSLDHATLLPIAESYAAFVSPIEPTWSQTIHDELRNLELSPPGNVGALAARIAVLSALPNQPIAMDPRPAAVLFQNLEAVEREAAENEFGHARISGAMLIRADEYFNRSLLPEIMAEVTRNSALLEGRTKSDIPELLNARVSLAERYRSNSNFLLADVQREEMISYLLGAFLTVQLINEGWRASHSHDEGIRLTSGNGRDVSPFNVVAQLASGDLSAADFISAIE
jgi:hypothetical protein